jgi:hypothetical protein
MKDDLTLLKNAIRGLVSEALVYGNEGPGGKFTGPPPTEWSEAAVMRGWARHVENLQFLRFMSKNGNPKERADANEELEICRRKIKYFENLPNYNKRVGEEMQNKIISQWAMKNALRKK